MTFWSRFFHFWKLIKSPFLPFFQNEFFKVFYSLSSSKFVPNFTLLFKFNINKFILVFFGIFVSKKNREQNHQKNVKKWIWIINGSRRGMSLVCRNARTWSQLFPLFLWLSGNCLMNKYFSKISILSNVSIRTAYIWKKRRKFLFFGQFREVCACWWTKRYP